MGRVGRRESERQYESWPGNQRFLCGGYLMLGPSIDWPYNLCAWSSILVPSVCYFCYAAPALWAHSGPLLPLFTGYMLLATLLCLCLTSCSDPGFIPRQAGQARPLAHASTDGPEGAVAIGSPRGLAGRQRRIVTELGPTLFTWCHTCEIWRPPKAHHCSECGHCVLGYDHHCPFVNNCVGVRNHFYFLSFLGGVCGLGITVFAGTIMTIQYTLEDWGGNGAPTNGTHTTVETGLLWFFGAMTVPVSILTVVLIGFLGFHTYLTCSGQVKTTTLARSSAVSPRLCVPD
jgi:palmitoyltransferase ZDHHC9/14/18